MVLGIGIGTGLQFTDPIVESLLTLLAARSGIEGKGRQIMSAHMSVESVPVRIRLSFRGKSCLLKIRCQQTVVIVLHQYTDIQVAGLFQRSVEQSHIPQRELIGIEPILCLDAAGSKYQHQQARKSHKKVHSFAHDLGVHFDFGTKISIIFEFLSLFRAKSVFAPAKKRKQDKKGEGINLSPFCRSDKRGLG